MQASIYIFQNLFTFNNHFCIGGKEEKIFYKSFWTCFCSIKKEPFNEVGGFNEDLFELEDVDIGAKFIKKGYKVLLDKSIQNFHNHKLTYHHPMC